MMRRRYNGNHKLILLENQNPLFLFHLRFSVQCDLKKSRFELKSLYGQKQKPRTNILTLAEIHILVKYLITVSSLKLYIPHNNNQRAKSAARVVSSQKLQIVVIAFFAWAPPERLKTSFTNQILQKREAEITCN